MSSYKQVIIVRADLKLSKGKMAAQVAHASLDAYKKAGSLAVEEWEISGSKKIVLKVDGIQQLIDIYEQLKQAKLKPSIIKDAGLTEVEPGTVTCLAVGPAEQSEIDKITGKLKMA